MNEYQAIIGVAWESGSEEQYCREPVFANDLNQAYAKAANMADSAPWPANGKLFVIRVEDWN